MLAICPDTLRSYEISNPIDSHPLDSDTLPINNFQPIWIQKKKVFSIGIFFRSFLVFLMNFEAIGYQHTLGSHWLKLTTAELFSTSISWTGALLCNSTNSIGAGISIVNEYEASSFDKFNCEKCQWFIKMKGFDWKTKNKRKSNYRWIYWHHWYCWKAAR